MKDRSSGRICISIAETTLKRVIKAIKEANRLADLIEIRMDYLRKPELAPLVEVRPKPFIITNRRKEEGGRYWGYERRRLELLKEAIDLGAEYVDMEIGTERSLLQELIENKKETQVILSFHDFHGTPSPKKLRRLYERMTQLGPDIVKIVTFAKSWEDNLQILSLIPYASERGQKIIAFCMGEKGKMSRIFAPLLGASWTYVSLSKERATAPGQMTVWEMKDLWEKLTHSTAPSPAFTDEIKKRRSGSTPACGRQAEQALASRPRSRRVEMIDAQTELYGIIGNPARHSLSPIIHNGAFRRMGLNAVYLAFEVKSLNEAIVGIRGLGIRGMSVTLPFKTEIIPLLDGIDEVTNKIKAVNTVVNNEGNLIGYNTDWRGALEALEEKIDLEGKRVILLGAGGASRAIGFGLKMRGCEVIISNRTRDKGVDLARELVCTYQPLSSIEGVGVDVIINATSVGMHPHVEESPFPKKILMEGMTVMDIVYRPLQTKLLREADEKGCLVIDGLEMLAHQGAAQFEIWTGMRPDLHQIKEDLRQALEEEIND
ncbi:MAG: shikimate dehydrogenase [Thermodesulfobacteriota bacterium]